MFNLNNWLDPNYIAYILRYFLAPLYVAAAIILARRTFIVLRERITRHLKPANGYFLLAQSANNDGVVQTFKLYHTTLIGSSKSSDIRIRDSFIKYRHALIYLYDGHWYLRPANSKSQVVRNKRKVTEPVCLKNEDVITLGTMSLVFIDERSAAKSAGFNYEGSWVEAAQGTNYEMPLRTRDIWSIFVNFYVLASLAVVLLIPKNFISLLPLAAGILGGFVVIAMLIYTMAPRLVGNFDRTLFTCFALLAGVGLVIQTRFAFVGRIQPDDWSDLEMLQYVRRDFIVQGGVALVGMLLLPLVVRIVTRTRWLEYLAPACLVITPALYIVTFVLGRGSAEWGAGLWIRLPGGLSIQLTEFAKISYLIVLALFFKNRPTFKIQIFFAFWAAVNFALIMILPDLGSMMILLPVTIIVYFAMTSEYLKTISILAGGSAIFVVAYHTMGYVQRRIYGWTSLWTEVNANNEQIIRALQAMARGGLIGRGLSHGNPRAIPLYSSDMVFAAITEEMGLILALGLVLIFVTIWLRGATAVPGVRDGFTSSLTLGMASYFFMEAAVVIGGVTGLIPLTGATLPFIAKGGSSMLAKWLMAGLLLGLYGRRERGAYETEIIQQAKPAVNQSRQKSRSIGMKPQRPIPQQRGVRR